MKPQFRPPLQLKAALSKTTLCLLALGAIFCLSLNEAYAQQTFGDFVKANASAVTTIDPNLDGYVIGDNIDLRAFGKVIGDARVVGFGEAAHGTHDATQMKIRLFQYLVNELGFRAISMESGLIEGELTERFVQGDPGVTIDDALFKGMTHGMGAFQETKDLLKWIRRHNLLIPDPNKKVHVVGFDLSLQGSAISIPLKEVGRYLNKAAQQSNGPQNLFETFAQTNRLASEADKLTLAVENIFKSKLRHEYIEPDWLDALTTMSFEQLSSSDQAVLEKNLIALKNQFSKYKNELIRSTSRAEYRWAQRMVIVANQYMRDLRSRQLHKPIGFWRELKSGLSKFGLLQGLHIDDSHDFDINNRDHLRETQIARRTRELESAENVAWVANTYGKTLVYAHNGHLMRVSPSSGQGVGSKSMGEYLREILKENYRVIVSSLDSYVDEKNKMLSKFQGMPVTPTLSCDRCIERDIVQTLELPEMFILDCRYILNSVKNYFVQPREMRFQTGFQPYVLGSAFDAIFWKRTATAAVPYKGSK